MAFYAHDFYCINVIVILERIDGIGDHGPSEYLDELFRFVESSTRSHAAGKQDCNVHFCLFTFVLIGVFVHVECKWQVFAQRMPAW